MATFESIHTGTAVDQAVERTLANKSKGDSSTPVYLDANGEAIAITKSTTPTEDDNKLITSGTMYTELAAKYNKADIATSTDLGTSTTLVPSQNAVKVYTDKVFSGVQPTVVAGTNIVKTGNELSVDPTGLMNPDELTGKREHYGEYVVGYQDDVLEKMDRAKHSTFDLSKFTVVGSPMITSDGIASGFSNSNYLTLPVNIGTSYSTFEMQFKNVNVGTGQQTIIAQTPVKFALVTNGTPLLLYAGEQGQSGYNIANQVSIYPTGLVNNTEYDIIFGYDGTKYYAKVKKSSDASFGTPWTLTSDKKMSLLGFALGYSYTYWTALTDGSIDLKQFSIIVDGVEVFSGNKTGIDTIKDVNFSLNTTMYAWVYDTHTIYANGYDATTHAPTELYDNTGRIITQSASTWQIVVDGDNTYVKYNGNNATYTSGSNITTSTADSPLVNPQLPIEAGAKITSDGIASGFGIRGSNGIDTESYIPTDKDFEIETEFVVSSRDITGMGQTHYILGTQYNSSVDRIPVSMYFNAGQSGSAVVWSVVVVDSNDTITTLTMSVTVRQRSAGDKIKTTLRRDKATGKYIATAIVNGEEKTPVSVDSTLDLVWSPRIYIGIQKTNYTVLKFFGSIDLNAFKIYVDGNLVYQPLLRIPYTQTVDGKKIVDSYYRSRVEDMYEQAKYTPYYSLQTENKGNYITVGSPTISSDFVASGFSNSNYIRTVKVGILNTDKFKVKQQFKLNDASQQGVFFSSRLDGTTEMGLALITNNSKFLFYASSNGTSWDITSAKSGTTTLSSNTDYLVELEFTGAQYVCYLTNISTGTKTIEFTVNSTSKIYNGSNYVTLGIGGWNVLNGSIDLKDFKIYVDDNLAYQAVIPPNYTMQTVKPSDLIDSKTSGANMYRQYANQAIEQYGTCTSGTAVTFEKPFMDTNYILTVPYSAKSKTGFTPTQTSSWKAKGKVSI